MRVVPLALLVSVVIAACGGSSETASTPPATDALSTPAPAASGTDPVTTETATAAADEPVSEVSAQLQQAGIDCTLAVAPKDDNTIELGVKVNATEYNCTVGDLAITYIAYGSSDDYESAKAQIEMYKPMMHSYGILEYLTIDGGKKAHWSAGVGAADDSDTPRPTEAQRTLAGKVADALDGKVVSEETA